MNMSTSNHFKSYLPAAAVVFLMVAASTLPQWAVADDEVAAPIAPPGDKGFLAPIVEQATPVTIFLVNGVKLQGFIQANLRDVLIIGAGTQSGSQLIYKHAISTIMPSTYSPD
jgi:RNA chaperone Hfq